MHVLPGAPDVCFNEENGLIQNLECSDPTELDLGSAIKTGFWFQDPQPQMLTNTRPMRRTHPGCPGICLSLLRLRSSARSPRAQLEPGSPKPAHFGLQRNGSNRAWRAPSAEPTLPLPCNLHPNRANGDEFKHRPGRRHPCGVQLWLGAGEGPHYKAFIHSNSLSPAHSLTFIGIILIGGRE